MDISNILSSWVTFGTHVALCSRCSCLIWKTKWKPLLLWSSCSSRGVHIRSSLGPQSRQVFGPTRHIHVQLGKRDPRWKCCLSAWKQNPAGSRPPITGFGHPVHCDCNTSVSQNIHQKNQETSKNIKNKHEKTYQDRFLSYKKLVLQKINPTPGFNQVTEFTEEMNYT